MKRNLQTVHSLYALLNPCTVCPHECKVNRLADEQGKCRTAHTVSISSYTLHFGEEPPISGFSGSGTIFFANCNLSCAFCQNYPISQFGHGNAVSIEKLSSIMLELQNKGAHNINLVTPTHVIPFIVDAIFRARADGLIIPLVYNSGGYEKAETLRLLEGIIDIYMPDAKYSDNQNGQTYSKATNYWEENKKALKEMHRQVGNLKINKDGIAERGMLIRHLVLPNAISGTKAVLEFIAQEISPDTYVSLMAQYHPAHNSHKYPELSRQIKKTEYAKCVKIARQLHLEKGWIQEL